jgi:hypothetical protein
VKINHQIKIDKLNRDVGKYHSGLEKKNWVDEDPLLYEMSLKKLQEIEDKVSFSY